MNARICTNPNCRTIQSERKCHLCKAPTEELPAIPLHSIGLDGTACLVHKNTNGYSLLITTISGTRFIPVRIPDLVHAAQLHLPIPGHVTGLMIMDALKIASNLIKTKNTGFWTGWIIYLLETLQDHADSASFQNVLLDLRRDITVTLLEDDTPPETP